MNMLPIAFVTAVSFVASAPSFADTVTIYPGQTVTLTPDTTTTVSCATNGTVIESFCACVDAGSMYMKNLNRTYILNNGKVNEVLLGRYTTVAACEQAKAHMGICAL